MKRPTNNRGVRTRKITHKPNQNNKYENKNLLYLIKSKYVLQSIFNNLERKKTLILIHHNKTIQEKININLAHYKKECKIILEIIPTKKSIFSQSNNDNKFINYLNEEDKSYYHIYFNDSQEEIKKNNFNKEDNISKIKIIIDTEIISFKNLFSNCTCIEQINFIKFNRRNIIDMSYMFYNCSS
mgnify:FL=1